MVTPAGTVYAPLAEKTCDDCAKRLVDRHRHENRSPDNAVCIFFLRAQENSLDVFAIPNK
jgi:hypothetical protein